MIAVCHGFAMFEKAVYSLVLCFFKTGLSVAKVPAAVSGGRAKVDVVS